MLATIGIIAVGGFRPAGILISTFCQDTSGLDAGGNYWISAWTSVGVYTNGTGGTYNSTIGDDMNGCFHPAGYYLSYNESPSIITWTNSHSGQNGNYTWFINYSWTAADGAGGSVSSGTGAQTGYYGTIINQYFEPMDGQKYIVAFDPNVGGTGVAGYYEYSISGAGTLLSSQCVGTDGVDAMGTYWSGSWLYEETYSDGTGGSYSNILGSNTNGCWYPAGYRTLYQQSDLNIDWSHGTSTGIFSYGYSYNFDEQSGTGGSTSFSGSQVTAVDGHIVNSYTANDPTTGYPTNYTLYFSITGNTLQTSAYIVAGTLMSSNCTTLYDYQDAKGLYWNVGAKQYQYADGVGGYSYTYQTGVPECGNLPSGYWTQYGPVQLWFYWYDYYNTGSTFYYGEEAAGLQADGTGNVNYLTDGITLYYPAGHIFYSYHDDAGQRTVNYAFDGVSGYVVQYVMD